VRAGNLRPDYPDYSKSIEQRPLAMCATARNAGLPPVKARRDFVSNMPSVSQKSAANQQSSAVHRAMARRLTHMPGRARRFPATIRGKE
jgi:hypothetical protein